MTAFEAPGSSGFGRWRVDPLTGEVYFDPSNPGGWPVGVSTGNGVAVVRDATGAIAFAGLEAEVTRAAATVPTLEDIFAQVSSHGVILRATPEQTGVSVGGLVAAWTNQSTSGVEIDQASSSLRPALVDQSGVLGVSFDGGNDFMRLLNLALGSSCACYFAIRYGAQNGVGSIHKPLIAANGFDTYNVNGDTYGFGLYRQNATQGFGLSIGHSTGVDDVSYARPYDGSLRVVGFDVDAGAAVITFDGEVVGSLSLTRTSGFGTSYALAANVAAPPNRYYTGPIQGAFIANGAITPTQRAHIVTRLAEIQGRTL